MKTKFLLFGALLAFYVSAYATTSKTSQIDVPSLHAEKDYLSIINQCSNPKLFKQILDKAIEEKDQNKRTTYAAQIEETMINNPSCFVAAVTKLGYKKCEVVEENFVKEPYFYPRHEIYRALSSASDFPGSCFAS
jgi:hypothetical protein